MTEQELKKIVVLGPESTGKSTLCEQLAQHYHTRWCPEFAREYLLTHGTDYNFNDLLNIAKGQLAMEEEFSSVVNSQWAEGNINSSVNSSLAIHHSPMLFVDTDMYVMKVWCEFVFNNCHPWILEQIAKRKYDLYLLCKTDLPWVKDELREYPDIQTREKLFCVYKDLLINQPTTWVEISGNYEERLRSAIDAVDSLFSK